MARFLLCTQYMENYAAFDWNGEGVCPQSWRPKGGMEYVYPVDDAVFAKMTDEEVSTLFARLTPLVETDNNYVKEFLLSTGIVPSSCKTPDEANFDQMVASGYAGEHERWAFSPKELTLDAAQAT